MDLTPDKIAGVVGGLLVLVVWIYALRDQRWWNRDQKRRREPKPDQPPPPEDRQGPWG